VNWQLQIKLEFYIDNVDLKGDPCDVCIRYLLFWNVSDSNKICGKSVHVSYCLNIYPKIVMSSLKDQTLFLSTYHSSFVFRRSWVQISPKRLMTLTDILRALYCKLSYYSFLPCDKLWVFVSWNSLSMCSSASWNFMHVSTKQREVPLRFQSLKTLPRQYIFLKSSMIRSTSTTFSRCISSSSLYSGQDRTVSTMFCWKE